MTAQTIAELAALAAQTEDQTEVTEGAGDFEPIAAGITVGRFIEYIELGVHPQKPYLGKAKPPCAEVRLTFELTHPKNVKEIEVDGVKKTYMERISLKVTKKLGEKAKFKKLFDKMAYSRADKKHMAQMLGEAFILTIYHNEVVKTVNGKEQKNTYANLTNAAGEIGIAPPFQVDAITQEKKQLAIPQALSPVKLFLFENPTKPTWDSLFIDGTRTVKIEGKEVEQSKNWIQETILSSQNYKGSQLGLLLAGTADLKLPTTEEQVLEELPLDMAGVTGITTGTASASSGVKNSTTISLSSADDALAALGLK